MLPLSAFYVLAFGEASAAFRQPHPRNASAASCLRSASPLTASVSRACRAAAALCSPGHCALWSCLSRQAHHEYHVYFIAPAVNFVRPVAPFVYDEGRFSICSFTRRVDPRLEVHGH